MNYWFLVNETNTPFAEEGKGWLAFNNSTDAWTYRKQEGITNFFPKQGTYLDWC